MIKEMSMIPKLEELHRKRSTIDREIAQAYKDEGYGVTQSQVKEWLLDNGFSGKGFGKYYKGNTKVTLLKTAFRVDIKRTQPRCYTVFGKRYEDWYQRIAGSFYTRVRIQDLDNMVNWRI